MPDDVIPASRKLGREDARSLAEGCSRAIVSKGKKTTVFTISGVPDDDLIDAMLGPTGNLRAPALRVGKTLLIGFDEEHYEKALGL
ncbi:hypothetical protein [Thioalkalivibrio sp. HK1]|uniref:hypothetical protein n=1 Tax=Thioalkalivibrio sp. HK1 TaxID=1469245 RepID=UPI0012DE332A|nr:hypothetical protein [Thioalkalivibrio sp. HK1]